MWPQKSIICIMNRKMGRPTEAKKDEILKLRIDESTKRMLEYCVQVTHLTKSEIVRKGIKDIYLNILEDKDNECDD